MGPWSGRSCYNSRVVRRLAVLLVVSLAACGRSASDGHSAQEDTGPTLVLLNAKIFTADRARPYAQAVAIRNGRFSAVGTSADIGPLVTSATRVIDVGQRLVVPGLIEAHAHFDLSLPGRSMLSFDLPYPGANPDQTLTDVEAAVNVGPGWIHGTTDAVFEDLRNWRHALDAVAPANPVLLAGWAGHTAILNSRALEVLGIAETVTDPIGGHWGRDRTGRLDGRADEAAAVTVLRRVMAPDLTVEGEAQNLRRAAAVYTGWGVTTVHHMADELPLASIHAAIERARLPLKWTVYAWGLPEATIGEAWQEVDSDAGPWPSRTRLGGSKWILDGSPFERGAFLLEDYSDRPGWRGRSNYTEAQLREILSGALTSRHQLAVHAVGDAEIDMVLRLMRELAPPVRWRGVRVRIEHGEGLFGNRLALAAELGAVVDQQPIHLMTVNDERGSPIQEHRWGARAARFAPLRSLLVAGVPLALSSDANGAEAAANPFLNIMIAVSYPRRPNEALTREQALTAYTMGGAYAERQEAQKGRIARGMAADLAVLSQDVLTVALDSLPATRSLLTVVDGTVVLT